MSDLPILLREDSVGSRDKAPAIPHDLEKRSELRRELLPEFLDAMTTEQFVTAPGASTQAVLDGAAETYDMSALADLKITVDNYQGAKQAAGTKGVTISGTAPAVASTNASADTVGVAVNGEAAQDVDIGTQAGGAAIAAALQAGIRALTPASAVNLQSYLGATVEYVESSFSTTLATQLDSGVKVYELKLADVSKLRKGDVLEVADQAGGPAAAFEVTVADVFRGRSAIHIESGVTPGEDIEVGAIVRKPDDYYKVTAGKPGNESQIVFSAGTSNDVAVALKLTSGAGASTTPGTDAVGVQTIPFVTADFSSDAAATAAEVAAAINKKLTGAIASDNGGSIRITSRKYGASANIQAESGVTETALGLGTTREDGSQSDITLDIADADVIAIQAVTAGTPGDYKSDVSIVRVEGDKLVNVDGTNYAADGVWRLTLSPSRPL